MILSLEECQKACKSTSLTTANVMYKANKDTVLMVGESLIDIDKGTVLAISGCGDLNPKGSSYFLYNDQWGSVPNDDVDHYANEILKRTTYYD